MSGPDWPEVESLIPPPHHGRLVARLAELDEAGRKALVKPMRAFSRSGEWGWAPRDSEAGLTLVGAAVLPDTRTTAAWLRRFPPEESMWGGEDRLGTSVRLVEVLVQRRPSWLPTLLQELADRLRFGDAGGFEVVDGLRVALKLPPPETSAYVAQWVQQRWRSHRGPTESDALRAEPEFARLIPLIIDEDGIAWRLRHDHELTVVVTEGLVDRDAVLDALLARLQRGGRPKATNDLVAVLNELAPTHAEVAGRLADYLALLPPGTASTVAAMAQAALISACDAGLIKAGDVVAASAVLLSRTEKKIVRSQLAWLAQHAKANRHDTGQVVAATAVALAGGAVDVQQRALRLVLPLAARLDERGREPLERLLPSLPSDLRAELATALGNTTDGQATPAAHPVTAAAPPPPVLRRAIAPLDDLDEVIEQFLVIMRAGEDAGHSIGIELEQVVEALPRLAGPNGAALRGVSHRFDQESIYRWSLTIPDYMDTLTVRRAVAAVAASLIGDQWMDPKPPERDWTGPPERALAERIFSLANALRHDRRVRVVSLPTLDSGAIDPNVLAERLRSAAGWVPVPLDLEQAQLRADPQAHPPPVVTIDVWVEHRHDPNRARWEPKLPPLHHTRAQLAAAPDDTPAEETLWSALAHGRRQRKRGDSYWSPETHFGVWPLLLPHHPEVIAAHLAPELSRAATARSHGLRALVRLAESDGPAGDAITLAVAHALNGGKPEAQAAGVDAILALAARGQFDGTRLGSRLAAMILAGEVVPTRLPAPLRDAGRAGAAAEIWAVMHQLLADLLASGESIAALADLLACASEIGEHSTHVKPIPGLDQFATRGGRSRQVTEAKRLAALLTPPG